MSFNIIQAYATSINDKGDTRGVRRLSRKQEALTRSCARIGEGMRRRRGSTGRAMGGQSKPRFGRIAGDDTMRLP